MERIRLLPLLLFLAAGTAFAQIEKYEGMHGTEDPVFSSSSDAGKCFIFAKHIVKAVQDADGGEDVSVYKRKGSETGLDACETKGQPVLEVKDSDNNSFFGLWGPYVFIDMDTSADSRDLAVYSLETRKTLITKSYSGDPKLVAARFLEFDAPSDKKGAISTCKEAAKWKRQGGGGAWVQGKKLDLQTLQETTVGTLKCVYME